MGDDRRHKSWVLTMMLYSAQIAQHIRLVMVSTEISEFFIYILEVLVRGKRS